MDVVKAVPSMSTFRSLLMLALGIVAADRLRNCQLSFATVSVAAVTVSFSQLSSNV